MKTSPATEFYRSFLLEDREVGWFIINAPERTHSGHQSSGPYSSLVSAERAVDQILLDSGHLL